MIRRFKLSVILSVLTLLGAASEGASYAVGSGDVLTVVVGEEDELSGEFQISDEGSIVYPLLGAVEVEGLDLPAIADLIRTRLAADYLVSPQVAVYVKEYGSKKVAVLGDVPKPGFFSLTADSSLLSLLSESGLKLAGADTTVVVTRSSGNGAAAPVPLVLKLDELLNPFHEQKPVRLGDRDRIFVKSGVGGRIIVSGKVKRPGVIALSEGMSVVEAINKAGGVADFGSLKGVRIVRESEEGSEVINVNVEAMIKGDASQDVPVRDGDIVVVPRRWF
jgi:polysaccharide biosynthesis/export protein